MLEQISKLWFHFRLHKTVSSNGVGFSLPLYSLTPHTLFPRVSTSFDKQMLTIFSLLVSQRWGKSIFENPWGCLGSTASLLWLLANPNLKEVCFRSASHYSHLHWHNSRPFPYVRLPRVSCNLSEMKPHFPVISKHTVDKRFFTIVPPFKSGRWSKWS